MEANQHTTEPKDPGRELARGRRRAVVKLASEGPISVEDIWRLFVTEKLMKNQPKKFEKVAREKSRVYLNGLERAGRLTYLGDVQLNEWGGRPRKMFASPSLPVNRGWLTHDTMLWVWLRQLVNATIIAGYDPELKWLQDAKVTFSNGRVGHVEMDTESESLKVLMDKFDRYRGKIRITDADKGEVQNEFLLFPTLSDVRIDKLKDRLKDHEVNKYILFAVWYDLVRGVEKPWQDCTGSRFKLYPVGG